MHLMIEGDHKSPRRMVLEKLISEMPAGIVMDGFQTVKEEVQDDGREPIYIYPWAGIRERTRENLAGWCKDMNAEKYPDVFDRYSYYIDQVPADVIMVMDELGSMESAAPLFCNAVLDRLDMDTPVIGCIRDLKTDFLDAVRSHERVRCFHVTYENVDSIYSEISEYWKQQWEKFSAGIYE